MQLNEIISVCERFAPLSISKEYCANFGHYDNSGIILNCGNKINKILCSLDFSKNAVKEALDGEYGLIITHHPAIFGGIKSIDEDADELSKKLALCIKGGVSVYSMHLNMDAAKKGVDYFLMQGLGGSEEVIMDKLSNGGYGRAYSVCEQTFKNFYQNAIKTFNSNKCRIYGKDEKIIKKVASFCGAGTDEKAINFALLNGVDAFVSSDMKHHNITALCEKGVAVIELTHYASENYGFINACKLMLKNISLPVKYYTDEIYL